MKTLEEFVQRLQNDPEFEQMAQSYENSEEFMKFVRDEGYNFTLDQLMDEFNTEPQAADQGKGPLKPGEGFQSAPPKAMIVPLSNIPGETKVMTGGEPPSNQAGGGQQSRGPLSPNFEGSSGGRRRGIKWRGVDSKES